MENTQQATMVSPDMLPEKSPEELQSILLRLEDELTSVQQDAARKLVEVRLQEKHLDKEMSQLEQSRLLLKRMHRASDPERAASLEKQFRERENSITEAGETCTRLRNAADLAVLQYHSLKDLLVLVREALEASRENKELQAKEISNE